MPARSTIAERPAGLSGAIASSICRARAPPAPFATYAARSNATSGSRGASATALLDEAHRLGARALSARGEEQVARRRAELGGAYREVADAMGRRIGATGVVEVARERLVRGGVLGARAIRRLEPASSVGAASRPREGGGRGRRGGRAPSGSAFSCSDRRAVGLRDAQREPEPLIVAAHLHEHAVPSRAASTSAATRSASTRR